MLRLFLLLFLKDDKWCDGVFVDVLNVLVGKNMFKFMLILMKNVGVDMSAVFRYVFGFVYCRDIE